MAENNKLPFGISPLEVVLGVVILASAYKVGQKFGLIKTEADEKKEKMLGGGAKELSAGYLKTLPKTQKYYGFAGKETPSNLAKLFYDSKGFFNDDEAKFWGALKTIKYKTQFAKVADAFFVSYKKDLLQYFDTFIDKSEMPQVLSYLEGLPSGLI